MRRARPGDTPRANGKPSLARRAAGEERTLTSVPDAGDGPERLAAREPGDSRYRRDPRGSGREPTGAVTGGAGAPAAERGGAREQPLSRLWHITLSVSGPEEPLKEVRRGLEQLARDHPFLLTSRYANDHAEIRYWEEARDLHDAAAVALRLWGEHRSTAQLPPWEIVGLEVIDRQTYHQRVAEGYGPPPASPVGVHPF
ncbi:hypothetical protein ACRAR1_20325 [Streptomyces sanyensis]|uniref:hypothetical protein n=1 Tax=Streptomyces sanyensis TaxID=568869 RepID=UPI003D77B9D7